MGHFDASILKSVLAPVESARGLPNELYIDQDAFLAEKKAVFQRNWAGIGFAKDIAERGDALPITFLGICSRCAGRTIRCGCSRTPAATAA
ncbi:MAG: hypothetical protein P8X75_00695 [Limibacillus sp.]